MVVGCSSDDDAVDPIITLPSPEIQADLLQGYWLSEKYDEKDAWHQAGLYFRADGSIFEANQLVIDHLNYWTNKHTDYKYNKMKFGPVYIN